jgi:hypothetical protein
MRRREFMVLAGVGALGLCLPLRAQQPKNVRRIGHLLVGTPTPQWAQLWDELRRLGYIESVNLAVERRYPKTREQLAAAIADLLTNEVEIIVTGVPRPHSQRSRRPRRFRSSSASVATRCSSASSQATNGPVGT